MKKILKLDCFNVLFIYIYNIEKNQDKKSKLTTQKPKKTMAKSTKSANKARMNMIQTEAKKLWADKSKHKLKTYADAVSKACKNLKKEGKM